MSTRPRRDDLLGAVAVIALLVSTATGSAFAMLGTSVAALILLAVFYRRQIGSGAILITLVAALTSALIGVLVAAR